MSDPIYIKCQHIFERSNLDKWLKGKTSSSCPLCRTRYTPADMQSHSALSKQIAQWIAGNPGTRKKLASPPSSSSSSVRKAEPSFKTLVEEILPPWIARDERAIAEAIFLIQWEEALYSLLLSFLNQSQRYRMLSSRRVPLHHLYKETRFPLTAKKNLGFIEDEVYDFVYRLAGSPPLAPTTLMTNRSMGKEMFTQQNGYTTTPQIQAEAIQLAVLKQLARISRYQEVLQNDWQILFNKLSTPAKQELILLACIVSGRVICATDQEWATAIETYIEKRLHAAAASKKPPPLQSSSETKERKVEAKKPSA
jgi:hypothetical protein